MLSVLAKLAKEAKEAHAILTHSGIHLALTDINVLHEGPLSYFESLPSVQ